MPRNNQTDDKRDRLYDSKSWDEPFIDDDAPDGLQAWSSASKDVAKDVFADAFAPAAHVPSNPLKLAYKDNNKYIPKTALNDARLEAQVMRARIAAEAEAIALYNSKRAEASHSPDSHSDNRSSSVNRRSNDAHDTDAHGNDAHSADTHSLESHRPDHSLAKPNDEDERAQPMLEASQPTQQGISPVAATEDNEGNSPMPGTAGRNTDEAADTNTADSMASSKASQGTANDPVNNAASDTVRNTANDTITEEVSGNTNSSSSDDNADNDYADTAKPPAMPAVQTAAMRHEEARPEEIHHENKHREDKHHEDNEASPNADSEAEMTPEATMPPPQRRLLLHKWTAVDWLLFVFVVVMSLWLYNEMQLSMTDMRVMARAGGSDWAGQWLEPLVARLEPLFALLLPL